MAGKNEKRFREIRKGHAWISILLLIITLIITIGVLLSFLITFADYIIDSKLTEQYNAVAYMTDLYNNAADSGQDDISVIMNGSGRSYRITSKDGEVLLENGEYTVGNAYGVMRLSKIYDNMYILSDSSAEIFSTNTGKYLHIDIIRLFSNLREYSSSEIVDLAYEENAFEILGGDVELLHLPFWIQTTTSDNNLITVRAELTFSMRDLDLFGLFCVIMAVLIVIVFSILLFNIIGGIVRRQRTLNVFFTDIVTKGHNWMWFIIKGEEFLKKRKNYSGRFAVVNLEFVNYRNFCVCHSIEEGEQMLCAVLNVLQNNTDRKREMCAHCNSSDFAMLLRFTDEQALERRLKTITEQLSHINSDHVFAFHAGVVIVEPDGTPGKDGIPVRRRYLDLETQYNNACTAQESLSDNDSSGIAFFDSKMIEEQKWVDIVQEHQRSAVENEEFMVYYQPKYDPKTDELRGAEALIRWQSPEFGFVPPGRIIPIFEKNGFITEIDHYMISHVARDQKQWLDRGFKCVPVSVNVSRAHFIESDLAEQIRDMVDYYGTPHDLIEIELTESAFFDDKKAMINTIEKLKSYGFAVSMDDFGSGYSSLNSLKDMPLDVLKLDAEFFRGENGGERGEIVVTEAIKLAKCLNMRTVAEGVEIREQVDFLAAQGCDMIQGYFYAKPMPKNEYETRMTDGKRPKDEITGSIQ